MKKNTLHKVMATALVGAMAMSTLTGCGSSADNTTADAGTKESVAESSAASTDAGASTAVAGIDAQTMLLCRSPYMIVVLPETDALM